MSIKCPVLCVLSMLLISATGLAHEQPSVEPADARVEQDVKHVLLVAQAEAKEGAKPTSGQGAFVFSWDQELTAAFPEDAKKHEPRMHGGFNEDPETGIVYTGIPGYGLCSLRDPRP